MSRYYVNKKAQANGDHEVHVSTCSFLPEAEHRQYLDEFSNCHSAVAEAKKSTQRRTDAITALTPVIRAR
jgi:hypothetical protein